MLLKVNCLIGQASIHEMPCPWVVGGGGRVFGGDDCTWNWLNIKGSFILDMVWVFPKSEYLEKFSKNQIFIHWPFEYYLVLDTRHNIFFNVFFYQNT